MRISVFDSLNNITLRLNNIYYTATTEVSYTVTNTNLYAKPICLLTKPKLCAEPTSL